MIAMKSRHQEMIQELEENFLIASRENQVMSLFTDHSFIQTKYVVIVLMLDMYVCVGKNSSQNKKVLPK